MKNKILFVILAFILSILPGFLYSQIIDKNILLRPLELPYNESKSRPPADIRNYANLPASYNNVNISNEITPQNEPSVKFNAKYPNRVVAAWRDFRTGVTPAVRRIGYSYSTDGGATWSASTLVPIVDPNHPKASDPVVVSDTAGNFYIATVSITNAGNLDLVIFKSTDGGVTFPIAYFAQGGAQNSEDKEWMVCDLTKGSSPYKNNLYISWTRFVNGNTPNIFVTKSTNGGVNWSNPVQISNTSYVQGSCPCIGPNGELNIVWLNYAGATYNVIYSKSTNGGANFTTPATIAQGTPPDIVISSSGITFPSIASDISGGPRNGWLYTVFCDSRNGDPDIFLIRSSNGGDNWSNPVRVNNDAIGNGSLQCWPWISVNETGNIAILFFDSRNGPGTTFVDAYLARSTDGGVTFINEKLSSEISSTGEPNTDVRYGDYINIDYSGNKIVPVWTDLRLGGDNQEIFSSVIDLSVGIKVISSEVPERVELMQNYPNPFNPSTNIGFKLIKEGFVTIKIYNIQGKEIETLVNGNLKAGIYECKFPGRQLSKSLSSGIYFYTLTYDNNIISAKTMVLKK